MRFPIITAFRIGLKRTLAFLHDLAWIPLALLLGYLAQANFQGLGVEDGSSLLILLLLCLPIQAAAFWSFGLYRGIWRFASLPDLIRIFKAVTTGTLVITSLVFLFQLSGVPRTVLVLYPVFLLVGLAGPRYVYRWIKDQFHGHRRREGQRTLVIGAGRAGEMMVRDLVKDSHYQPIAFLDDDPAKRGSELHGVRVLGSISLLAALVDELSIEVVLIAMPSASSDLMRRITDICRQRQVPCLTLPTLQELHGHPVRLSQIRGIRIEDLLGRQPVKLDTAVLHAFLDGKRVLITGAAGSIGSELCRQVAGCYAPEKVIMLDHSEYGIYRMDEEMRQLAPPDRIVTLLGDVRDPGRMRQVFAQWQPQVVLHAAACKHVPLVELNAAEGIKTNVLGTRLVADLAVEYGVEKFLLVSTDKAVNPCNIMGATKRAAEIYCQALQHRSNTAFIITRFGNVLNSAGSVVPLFERQIAAGGPVTVTHPEVTRFFMTIPEAVSLILQSAAMGDGGEVFVLDMGEPVRIVDLAQQMIRLYDLDPEIDIGIEFIGLRPGEKLHEELFHSQEALVGTAHAKILRAQARQVEWEWLQRRMSQLVLASRQDDPQVARVALHALVPEFVDGDARATVAAPSPLTRPTPIKAVG
ncbi:NDP-sugar epimerase, includes UDP-GlcNAc-inverting 4,6-dehydratase FlaA1 and capsular polysaccharide biosynthesis protein EpsC [Ectothiorhodospira magna]|uniref:NDP-sugar epimerase, includes UDP-GlcNAc-inverting 4,6-dehydratase FlaA1 and capsular polysaccharide biosynthesis protein EpsC n=1 Tax=Ectothiorhodospira magna TaxID=867345 RepID=A0A1H9BJ35_9GAMM|nr:nucleoside-diphosphate sugar epimerase/dehydratase [Ectothiorhodospira magna]SEP88633.1 NDP-sugar epimerase, includes UDP-GlcNAc-inverting 4,6-dehydratase FlaA1 and capsular polysaccharide biosynthesis protein EpsC [Ectothiorhodospira magna]